MNRPSDKPAAGPYPRALNEPTVAAFEYEFLAFKSQGRSVATLLNNPVIQGDRICRVYDAGGNSSKLIGSDSNLRSSVKSVREDNSNVLDDPKLLAQSAFEYDVVLDWLGPATVNVDLVSTINAELFILKPGGILLLKFSQSSDLLIFQSDGTYFSGTEYLAKKLVGARVVAHTTSSSLMIRKDLFDARLDSSLTLLGWNPNRAATHDNQLIGSPTRAYTEISPGGQGLRVLGSLGYDESVSATLFVESGALTQPVTYTRGPHDYRKFQEIFPQIPRSGPQNAPILMALDLLGRGQPHDGQLSYSEVFRFETLPGPWGNWGGANAAPNSKHGDPTHLGYQDGFFGNVSSPLGFFSRISSENEVVRGVFEGFLKEASRVLARGGHLWIGPIDKGFRDLAVSNAQWLHLSLAAERSGVIMPKSEMGTGYSLVFERKEN